LALAAAALGLGALWLPVVHRVDCQCRLEPVLRRYIAAPYEGVLEKALVQPGDLVAADDVLAQLDGREIRWELAGLRADRDQAAKKRDTALAAQRFAEAQLAKLEMDRLEQKIRVLEHRQEHLAVKCPLEGIVISGDLERTQGAPVTLGQRLFEVAPLDEMVVEVAVPQDEIAYVARGMEVTVRLDAYPHEPLRGTIHQIRPRAQVLDEQNVFVAEVSIDNTDRRLRPGMTGRVHIEAGRRSLGWVWLHKPWESLLRLGGW
jgi:RND family efflux transporter MFP subunit